MLLASGSLIRANALLSVGEMRESFFIDYVDTDWCLRAVSSGWRLLVSHQAVLTHRLGAAQRHDVNRFVSILTKNHSADRRFTIFRNRLFMWREYWRRVPCFVSFDMIAACYDLLRIVLIEKNKGAKLRAALKGTLSGFGYTPESPGYFNGR